MNVVWDLGRVTVAQVHEHLGRKQPVAYTTIMTIMGRLEKKGLLQRASSGKAYIYSAAVSQEEFSASIARGLLDSLLTDFARPALPYFVEKLSEEDASALDELEKLIQERKTSTEK